MKYKLNFRNNNGSDQELLEDLKRVALQLGRDNFIGREYDKYGQFSHDTIAKRFETWNKALGKAGLEITFNANVSEKDLFENLENVWVKLGHQPVKREMKKPLSKYTESPYINKFKSWKKALNSFVKYINSEDDEIDLLIIEDIVQQADEGCKHLTKRNPSNRLKLKVMWRDGNECRLCGAKLSVWENGHFDHIIPWSKCGETVLENLQILCVKCNYVKGNLDYSENP